EDAIEDMINGCKIWDLMGTDRDGLVKLLNKHEIITKTANVVSGSGFSSVPSILSNPSLLITWSEENESGSERRKLLKRLREVTSKLSMNLKTFYTNVDEVLDDYTLIKANTQQAVV